jgi:hypothetical protein
MRAQRFLTGCKVCEVMEGDEINKDVDAWTGVLLFGGAYFHARVMPMKTKPEAWMRDPYAPSRYKRWVWLSVGVVMVYLFVVPPVTVVVTTGWPLSTAYAKRGARPEGWVKSFRVPYEWLAGKAFAKGVLKGYERWWWNVMIPMKKGRKE